MKVATAMASMCALTVFFMTFFLLQTSSSSSDKTVKSAFTNSGLFPDVVAAVPENVMQVVFGKNTHIYLGTEIVPAKAAKPPAISYEMTQHDVKYTVIMIDPDAPNSENGESWLHWIVVNIPGDKVKSGKEITPYARPTPPRGTGVHRYVLLAYQQSQQLDPTPPSARGHFRLRDFVTKYGLGEPWAGNYFLSQYMD